jgi:plasmid stabilization system protein ParE
MKLPIVFRRAARAEFDQAHDWYEKQRRGLGERFLERAQEVLERIAGTPELHQCIFKDVRRGVIRGFPYSILYRVQSDQIRVIAVFHSKRDPAIWQARI